MSSLVNDLKTHHFSHNKGIYHLVHYVTFNKPFMRVYWLMPIAMYFLLIMVGLGTFTQKKLWLITKNPDVLEELSSIFLVISNQKYIKMSQQIGQGNAIVDLCNIYRYWLIHYFTRWSCFSSIIISWNLLLFDVILITTRFV